jgi:capsular exopolysaccharide synthesis family protein
MSRIFDALQRSGTEKTGTEYPDMTSLAQLLEAHPEPASRKKKSADPRGEIAATLIEPLPPVLNLEEDVPVATEFSTLQTAVTPSSRLVFMTEPDSLAAEKFRFLGVRLRQLQQNRTLKKVLVTSTIPNEGKSFVSSNLAGVLSRRGKKVLLLEGDLRRPVLAEQFGLQRLGGLSEWLQSGQPSISNIYHLDGPGFYFLPAGNPPSNPLELMQSGQLSRLMTQLSAMFDWIIVDSPPILPLADTTIWMRLADGTLLVVREGTTEKAMLQRGVENLKNSSLLGIVLNGSTDTAHDNYYQRYAPPATK